MQKITAYVAPVRAGKGRISPPEKRPLSTDSTDEQNGQPRVDAPSDGSELKIEALLSDGQARRILESLLERKNFSDADCLIDDFLELGFQLAGPDASDLYERIVMAVERRLISRVYDECGQVKTKAAARLGINRNTLNKRLRFHRLIEDAEDDVTVIEPSHAAPSLLQDSAG
ncbi:MAG: helix-turn-helix domain-containing protein [Planctomycetaceae bacterium]